MNGAHMNNQQHGSAYFRADQVTRELVDQAIAAIPEIGIPKAAQFLAAMSVPADVAIRVLLHPNQRRTPAAFSPHSPW